MTHTAPREITYARVAAIALPVVLSNAMVPLQGAIDTAIIGNLGEARYLAAVALGATIITLLFVVFNFLQMGVSGLTAQALGAGDGRRVMNTLVRAGLIALVIAGLLILFRGPLGAGALGLFEGSAEAEALGGAYVGIRIWGAPAELVNYALMGWFAGQGLTRRMFEMQMVISLTNIALNLIFVYGFGWGVEGVALGTVLAAFTGLGLGLWRVRQRAAVVAPPEWRFEWARILDRAELTQVMALNRDIFIRTAPTPLGPFSDPVRIFGLEPKPLGKKFAGLVYCAFLHEALFRDGGRTMALTYCVVGEPENFGRRYVQRFRPKRFQQSLSPMAKQVPEGQCVSG